MSDDAFAPPRASSVASAGASSSLVRGLAITAIILGVLGSLGLVFGVFGALVSGWTTEQLVQSQPPPLRDVYRDLLASQQTWAPVGIVINVLGLGVCGLMIFGGIRTLAVGALGALRLGALLAAAFDLVAAIAGPLFAFGLSYGKWQAYLDAAQAAIPDPAARGAVTGGVYGGIGGAVVGGLFYVAMAAFWFWAAGRIGAAQAADGE